MTEARKGRGKGGAWGGEEAYVNKIRLHKRLLDVSLVIVIAELPQNRVQHRGVDEVLERAAAVGTGVRAGGGDHVQSDRRLGRVEGRPDVEAGRDGVEEGVAGAGRGEVGCEDLGVRVEGAEPGRGGGGVAS